LISKMASTRSIDLIHQIIQPFQRSLDEALRIMDCSIDEERSLPVAAEDATFPVSNADDLSQATPSSTGSELPLADSDRPAEMLHSDLFHQSKVSQSPSPTGETDTVGSVPEASGPETASGLPPAAAKSLSPDQRAASGAAPGRAKPISGARPSIKPNTAKADGTGPAVTDSDPIPAGPHGVPFGNGRNTTVPFGKEITGDIPESTDRTPKTPVIERPRSPRRHTLLNAGAGRASPVVKSAALIPLKALQNGSPPQIGPAVNPVSASPAAPRPVRQAAGKVAEGLDPVLDQAYGISQQAFGGLTEPVPGKNESPPATRVNNNFHVKVSMSGNSTTNTEQHEAFEEALVDILRLAARRHGLEV
jgi:hypothetical protein